MKITDEKPIAQNQKVADGKSRKTLIFDFNPSCMDEKTIKIEQKFQNNIISNRKKVNPARTELTQINKLFNHLIKKEVCL